METETINPSETCSILGRGTCAVSSFLGNSVAWVARSGGKTTGYSVRAIKKTGSVLPWIGCSCKKQSPPTVEAAQEVETEPQTEAKAESKFSKAFRMPRFEVPQVKLRVGTRLRTRKRIRRLRKEVNRLEKRMAPRLAAAAVEGAENPADDERAHECLMDIRERVNEIQELTKALQTPAKPVEKAPESAAEIEEAPTPVATPSHEPIVTASEPATMVHASTSHAATPESKETVLRKFVPTTKQTVFDKPPAAAVHRELPKSKPAPAPVEKKPAAPVEKNIVSPTITTPKPATVAPKPKTVRVLAPSKSVAQPKKAKPQEPVKKPTPPTVPLASSAPALSMREIVANAQFELVSEKLLFSRVVSDIETGDVARKESAVANLRKIPNPAVVELLVLLCGDAHKNVRIRSLETLIEQDIDRAKPLIQKALKDRSSHMRVLALRGLYEADPQQATPTLIKALDDKSGVVRRRAVACLGWSETPEVAMDLLPFIDDPDESVRKAVFDALESLKNKIAIPRLIDALDSEDLDTRQAAFRALKALTKQNLTFTPKASQEARDKGKARWEEWWEDNRTRFQVR